MIEQASIQKILLYDSITGLFLWKEGKRKYFGKSERPAGRLEKSGYMTISIDRKSYLLHRIAWLYVYGTLPYKIDHKDTIKHHNWIDNLREATDSQNSANSKVNSLNQSGIKGVHFNYERNKWQADIYPNGNSIYLGLYETAEEAHAAYYDAARKYYGEFANAG